MTKNNLKIVKSSKNQEIENKEKNKALEAAINQIDENFGKGSVMKLGQKTALDVESVSTGSLSLDLALGIGGLPKGRVIEIYGPEGSGKTTLALQVVAEAQKTNGICGFIDAEHALDPVYAKKLGVKTEELLISQPDTGEQALEIADTLVGGGELVVVADRDPEGKTIGVIGARGRLDGLKGRVGDLVLARDVAVLRAVAQEGDEADVQGVVVRVDPVGLGGEDPEVVRAGGTPAIAGVVLGIGQGDEGEVSGLGEGDCGR